MKRLIRLTESDLHRIVKESVKRVIKEDDDIWGNFSNDQYNAKDSQYTRQPIDPNNINQIKSYVKAANEIGEKLKNCTSIQNDKMAWQGLTHMMSYLGNLYTYVTYNMQGNA
jgi:hypothetical protein